jgi:hypothetical protein
MRNGNSEHFIVTFHELEKAGEDQYNQGILPDCYRISFRIKTF